jgi:DNA helicase-2/ATP-dependent DNA helicase PcrA
MKSACEGGFAGNDARLLAQRGLKSERVEIMTMTSSKGLEFSRVLIPGMDQGSVPSYHSSKFPAQMPEERRKFYVSLTRAKDSVEFFYSGYTEGRFGPMRKGPSVFLGELGLLS